MKSRSDIDTPVQFIKGIGPKRAEVLAEKGIATVRDLIYYFPFDYLDLGSIEKVEGLRTLVNSGKWISVIGTVRAMALLGRPPRQRFVLTLADETGTVQLVFFRSVSWFKQAYQEGETLAVSGKVTGFGGRIQIVHPSIDRIQAGDDEEERGFLHTNGFIPKYGSSEDLRGVNLHVKGLRRIMRTAVDEFVDSFEEFMPEEILRRNKFSPLRQALRDVHFPPGRDEMSEARRRLKFDELFTIQLLLSMRRKLMKKEGTGIFFNIESKLARQLVDSLDFDLTDAQVKVIREITGDMNSNQPMNRLLQGDVGSGKTIVALVAMCIAVENGYQAAFMAPTEILAEQHFRTIAQFLKDLPLNIRLLVGSQKSALRLDILDEVRSGRAQIVVGTHALIQEGVGFGNLGLVIIDEQHRFGVSQRVALRGKGAGALSPDVLVMTATPIPRTLTMTLYGDLDVSTIDRMPASRKEIKTAIRSESGRRSVYDFIRAQVKEGRQAYIVYPLIDTSEKLDLKAATEAYEQLRTDIFPDIKVGLVHGRLTSEEKENVMSAFKEKKLAILVATSVIEVGIDIPNATIMVIEHAERFGLSQLHQLRGRVGRGAEQSYCILMAPDWMKQRARASSAPTLLTEGEENEQRAIRRMKTMEKTSNGFKIAEIDLEIRGPGDFFGTRQSGMPELQIANLITDGDLLSLARSEALQIVDNDPQLRSPDHERLRTYIGEKFREVMPLIEVG